MKTFAWFKTLSGKLKRRSHSQKTLPLPEAKRIPRQEHVLSRADISDNALKVLYRLNYAGFDAYLVGGGVRDLMLRHAPKDFDVVTNASPEEIRKLFKNCRLIGRRFRLAHIHFGREIIEAATFRAIVDVPHQQHLKDKSGMITRDNVYGTLPEDAVRRDFTINALYYNIADFSLLDHTTGVDDLENKIIRLIGEPEVRYREDPVRMLRAIRFAAKLDFTIEPETEKPLWHLRECLLQVPKARLFDEALKLFHGGYGAKTFALLRHYQLFGKLFPISGKILDAQQKNKGDDAASPMLAFIEHTLASTDARVKAKKPITPAFILAAFLWHPLLEEVENKQKAGTTPAMALESAIHDILRSQTRYMSIPRRLTQVVREIWLLQYRFTRRWGKRPMMTYHHPRFRAGYDFLLIRAKVGDAPKALAKWWTQFQEVDEANQIEMIQALKSKPKKSTQKTAKKPPKE